MTEQLCYSYLHYTMLYTQAVNADCIDARQVMYFRATRAGHVIECPICQAHRREMAELVKEIGANKNDKAN